MLPSAAYCEATGDSDVALDLDVHGTSTFLALLQVCGARRRRAGGGASAKTLPVHAQAAVGVVTSRLPAFDDEPKGLANFMQV